MDIKNFEKISNFNDEVLSIESRIKEYIKDFPFSAEEKKNAMDSCYYAIAQLKQIINTSLRSIFK